MNNDRHGGIGRPARDILPAFADQRLITFFDAWRAARLGSSIPSKRNFDPMEVPSLLRYTWLYRFEPTLGDFICLVAGEDIKRAWGGDSIKGKLLYEIVGEEDHSLFLERWHAVIETPLVQYGTKNERLSNQALWRAERLILPLAADGERADHVIGVSLYRLASQDDPGELPNGQDIYRIPCSEL